MITKTSDGMGICSKCGSPNFTQTVRTAEGNTTYTVCSKEDRTTCKKCGTIDWTGKLQECCGTPMIDNPFKDK